MSRSHYPTIDYLLECLRYEDGRLFWLKRPLGHFPDEGWQARWNTKFAGKEAGGFKGSRGGPRWSIGIDCVSIFRTVVVWAIHKGDWPPGRCDVDHIDGDGSNDRIENLRLASRSQNMANSRFRTKSKDRLKGAYFRSHSGRWYSCIKVDYRKIYLGTFYSEEEAHEAYMDAAQKHFGEFACSG